jgi:tRNA-dihydrouridine synthase C
MLTPSEPALVLAPMEGVTDAPMRAVQGEAGAFTYGVSEFLRVSHTVLSRKVIERFVPELRTGARTTSGLPVQVQLLGGDSGRMAESAAVAVDVGATAIDINFGCPAKTVNRHDGGATLLKYPKRIREIVAAVRGAVPPAVPVSAKLRLGWDTTDAIDENAAMAAEGGAAWLTIHGRTRFAGYAPPIHWAPIGRVRERLGLPVVANGDIWTIDDFRRCRDVTGCRHFMLGRGALANPHLSRQVAAELGLAPVGADDGPCDWVPLLRRFVESMRAHSEYSPRAEVRRLKQWLKLAATHGTFDGFEAIKRANHVDEILTGIGPDGRSDAFPP